MAAKEINANKAVQLGTSHQPSTAISRRESYAGTHPDETKWCPSCDARFKSPTGSVDHIAVQALGGVRCSIYLLLANTPPTITSSRWAVQLLIGTLISAHWHMTASAQHYATTTPETCTHGATSNNHYVGGHEIHHGRSLWTFKQVRVLPSPGSPHSAHRLQVAYDN